VKIVPGLTLVGVHAQNTTLRPGAHNALLQPIKRALQQAGRGRRRSIPEHVRALAAPVTPVVIRQEHRVPIQGPFTRPNPAVLRFLNAGEQQFFGTVA